ncbi:hypothetical protein [Thermococcus aciditolerans]|uniref:CPBP family intramembrane metalloprotease n=1 Tax=Thermococcus aciditolerans TaxID=2598455 RepID=A0A5C0SHJ0_9EURY|nr:hypothetical protein [Thermococcus aciditolerans]QEK13791.1 hypothetical protein FPV09_00115 [Thermococcus aciditolerans]
MRKLITFALVWFIFVVWGIELGVAWVFKSITGSWISQSSSVYLSKVWTINCLRLLAVIALLRWLGLSFGDLTRGSFGTRELRLSLLVVFAVLLVEVAYYLKSYSPQILREFHYHLGISQSTWLALASLASEYVYYTLEILAVNLLYRGALKLGNERFAVLLPTVLWGSAHALNVIVMPPIEALLLAVYMTVFAFLIYNATQKTRSLKVPIFIWLVSMAL